VVAVMNQDTNSVMLGNHGSVCFDRTLMGAYYKLEILDAYCRPENIVGRMKGEIFTIGRRPGMDAEAFHQ
ncbi:MAG: hypothetical protein M1588_04190, partial [Planctomycetes bacterium]|nr:hypothetical protein [Planctomycetota bacterium]